MHREMANDYRICVLSPRRLSRDVARRDQGHLRGPSDRPTGEARVHLGHSLDCTAMLPSYSATPEGFEGANFVVLKSR